MGVGNAGVLVVLGLGGMGSLAALLADPTTWAALASFSYGSLLALACLCVSTIIVLGLLLEPLSKFIGQKSPRCKGEIVFPATAWPVDQSRFAAECSFQYNLQDPLGSFKKVGELVIEEILAELPKHYELPDQEIQWVAKMLEYNTQGGKCNRGMMVINTGMDLLKFQGKEPTNTDLTRLAVLGWSIEVLQVAMLMADDLMDSSLTRRGRKCWCTLEDVKMIAINDFLMVEMMVYKILRRHFGLDNDLFVQFCDLFHETVFQTECGQLMDILCENCNLKEFTHERWTLLSKYKTAFYSFYLPIAASMLAIGCREKSDFDTARNILVQMGIYFQAQDDYLDCFGTPEQIGKVGTDIQDKKCSWVFVNAYLKCKDDQQKRLLEQNYGQCKAGSEEEKAIKKVYQELGLPGLWERTEEDTYKNITCMKNSLSKLPWAIFEKVLNMIYRRRK